MARQEEELAARERDAGAAEAERRALGADLGRARSEAEALQVRLVLPGDVRRLLKPDTSLDALCTHARSVQAHPMRVLQVPVLCGRSRLEAKAHDV